VCRFREVRWCVQVSNKEREHTHTQTKETTAGAAAPTALNIDSNNNNNNNNKTKDEAPLHLYSSRRCCHWRQCVKDDKKRKEEDKTFKMCMSREALFVDSAVVVARLACVYVCDGGGGGFPPPTYS